MKIKHSRESGHRGLGTGAPRARRTEAQVALMLGRPGCVERPLTSPSPGCLISGGNNSSYLGGLLRGWGEALLAELREDGSTGSTATAN